MTEQFKLEIMVTPAPKSDGFVASSPQIKDLSAWGATIEYAVMEYCFGLHMHTEVMVENGRAFDREGAAASTR
jgi:predicted RNase H-like HicB family nuclease